MSKSKIFFLLCLALVFLVFFLVPKDTDLGWHLRYGEEIVRQANLRPLNNLTYYLNDYPWSLVYTIYDAILYAVFHNFGLIGLSIISALLGGFMFFLFGRFYPKLPKLSFLLFLGITITGWSVFSLGFRPQVMAYGFLLGFLLLLAKSDNNKKLLLLIPLTVFVWANSHGSFILAFPILSAAVLDQVFSKNRRAVIALMLVTGASFVATFLNPYGLGAFKEALTHLQVPLGSLIAEWVPPNTLAVFIILLSTLTIIMLTLPENFRRKVFWYSLIFIFSILAIKAHRNIPLFTLVLALTFAGAFESKLKILEENTNFNNLAPGLILLGIIFLAVFRIPDTASGSSTWGSYCSRSSFPYPCRAIEYLQSHPQSGKNVFSAYEWGGVLEWQLPRYKYFVDGRMPAWTGPEGKSPYTVYLETIQARPGYQETLDHYKTDWLFIGSGSFLDIELSQKKDVIWHEIYRDDTAVIYTKS